MVYHLSNFFKVLPIKSMFLLQILFVSLICDMLIVMYLRIFYLATYVTESGGMNQMLLGILISRCKCNYFCILLFPHVN